MRHHLRALSRTGALALLVLTAACGDDDATGPAPSNPAPTGVAAAATAAQAITITWTAPSTPADQFILERAEATGSFAEIARPTGTATNHLDAGLAAGTSYRYRLAALRDGVVSAYSAVASAITEGGSGSEVRVTEDIVTNTRWTRDHVYRLVGFRKVANGATLTIDAGTRIVGDYDVTGSSLFVLRGARIVAVGTPTEPIVFTSDRPVGERRAGDWGGLILVGNGIINRSGVVNVEGTGTSAANPSLAYSGGDNNFDSSGRLSYVRVEYAGFAPAPDAELNSFTFAAVGSQTVLDHLQAHGGLDDSYEFFGGAADLRYAVSTETGDDHFDMSEGYQGRIQYFVAVQTRSVTVRPDAGGVASDPQGIENDGCNGSGCDNGHNSTPFTTPVVANGTIILTGPGVVGPSGGFGMVLRRGTGGHYVNLVIARGSSAGIGYRDTATRDRETAGLLSLKGILIAETPAVFESGQQVYGGPASDIELVAGTSATSLFSGLVTHPTSMADLNLIPAAGSPIATGGATAWTGDLATRGQGLDHTTYRGAFAPGGTNWMNGWTAYSEN
jgi:hypothetical protein